MRRRSSPASKPLKPNDSQPREVRRFDPDRVVIPEGRRPLNETVVAELVESIRRFGLLSPIAVRMVQEIAIPDKGLRFNVPVLVAGRHRLEACQRLGLDSIDGIVFDGDESEARLAEISENLHRAELTEAERRQHIAAWVRLTAEKVSHRGTPLPGGSQPTEKAIRKASAELNIPKSTVARAVAAESLPPEVKDAADDAGLGTVKRAKIAAEPTPEAQLNAVQRERDLAAARRRDEMARRKEEAEALERKELGERWRRDQLAAAAQQQRSPEGGDRLQEDADRYAVVEAFIQAKGTLKRAMVQADRIGHADLITKAINALDVVSAPLEAPTKATAAPRYTRH